MSSNKTHVSFINYEKKLKIPFVIYGHFESLQVPQKNRKIIHTPCGFAYSLKCCYNDSLSTFSHYIGKDSPEVFWERLKSETYNIAVNLRRKAEPNALNEEEKEVCAKMSVCHLCRKELIDEERVEDFHFLSGELLGAAHIKCSQRIKVPYFVPVVMNKFSKYAKHFLLKDLSEHEVKEIFFVGDNQGFIRKINGIALRFMDMKQFIDEKIEDLQEILNDRKKRKLRREFAEFFSLMKNKMYFPYYYVTGFDILSFKNFPPGRGFYDQLHDQEISEENYNRCHKIWKSFQCKTISDFLEIYLKQNTFLLEDIFESFRNLCLDKYSLDLLHYFTIASFSWDSMLRYTGVTLEVLQDKEMIKFIKQNIRGGISQCSKRHSKANNKYCSYDPSQPSTYIVYLDANNLGGWAMSQMLPYSNFRWLYESEIQKFNIHRTDIHTGYFLEVDLDYPEDLYAKHNDLPFCLAKLKVPPLSNRGVEKGVLSFFNKKNYVIELRHLQQCLENGLILRKIHRALSFRQTAWLRPYIIYNTKLRAKAQNDFETKLYKLLNNSVFGKTIQRTSTDKPIYAGFSILELSKQFMYNFHYNTIVKKYGHRARLLYMDTDGLIYEIETEDFFQDMKNDPVFLDLMDTSNLDSKWGIPRKNKKVLGKMKQEYDGRLIREFFGVRSKLYFLDVEGEEIKKAASMKKYVKQKYIAREHYEKCALFNEKVVKNISETHAEDHVVVTYKTDRVVMTPGDLKRCILKDNVHTKPWGYEL